MTTTNAESNLDAKLREELLRYLKKARKEPLPHFPTEYAALMYVALGTVKLFHEVIMDINKVAVANGEAPLQPHYPAALQEVVSLLETLAPTMESAGHDGQQIYIPGGH